MNKLTKQIISFALVLYTVFMLCFTAFAAETTNKVNYDKTSVEDDLKSVYGNALSLKFPKISSASSDISVIYVFENGYDAKEGIGSSDYGLYVYMYIPSGIKLSSSILHTANIACGWEAGTPNDFENVHLELLSQSESGTLAKFKVIGLSLSNIYISDKERSYCISSVDIYSGGTNAKANRVAKVFTFYEENGERKCKTKDLTVVDIDVYQTSYLSGGSAKGANYSNQVNTAIFSIPNDLMDKYGDLYSVKYEYYKYRTAPIFIIDSSKTVSESSSKKIYDQLMSDRGKIADDSWNYTIFERSVLETSTGFHIYWLYYMAYGNVGALETGLVNIIKNYYYDYASSFWRLNNLTTVFPASDVTDHDNIFVSADRLQQYFLEYDKSFYNGKVRDKYSADLFDLNCFSEDDIYHCETISVDDSAVTLPSYKDVYGWFKAWLCKQKGETVTYDLIYQLGVNVDDLAGTDEEISERLLVSPSSVSHIKEIYSEAGEDSTVFLLRYAGTDDYFTSDYLTFENHTTEEETKNIGFYSCETVYLDFDIIQFSFKNYESKEITVISVSSSPTDGFTDIMNTNGATPSPPKDGCDGFDSFKEIIAVLLVCVLVYFVISIYSKLKRNKIVVNVQDKNDRRRD